MYFDQKFDRLPTLISGLKWRPSLCPPLKNSQDNVQPYHSQRVKRVVREFSDYDMAVLEREFDSIKQHAKCIVEIGVNRNPLKDSSTAIFLNHKRPETVYIGVDLQNKTHLNDPAKKIYTVKASSSRKDLVFHLMDSLKLEWIDFLFIDGWHSVDQVINDWTYTQRLAPKGIVGMHDVSVHPGPKLVFDAIDEKAWNKDLYERDDDWGIGIVRRNPD